MSLPDAQLHQILAQMQAQAVAAQRELSRVRAQSSSLEGARRRAELTRRQVEEEKDATLWVGRGKMFLKTPSPDVQAELLEREQTLSAEVANLGKKMKFLEKQAAEAQGHLRDVFRGMDAQQRAT
ncbi:hypothetical protein FA09DRAFT_329820 [Tilletiopsis washingtonensis]|uniref:Prefoldin n=1 Tax=Tilletiopsis washingtonensis TaxID=58919 RepID=A0A316Z9E4_9BASI|nr:hypothetical protein FA09DRAFT_329820 [Tilletiopsis washingtonensis]PWN98201.1 hypothetical protein FA09DRAFT_329820 [Tilletiopsis washingtonensis]